MGKTEREVLRGLGLGPDFDVFPAEARTPVDFIHRRTAREEIYFLRNADSMWRYRKIVRWENCTWCRFSPVQ